MREFRLQGAEEQAVAAEAVEIRRLRDKLGPTGNTTSPCRWCGVAHNPMRLCAVDDLLAEIGRLRVSRDTAWVAVVNAIGECGTLRAKAEQLRTERDDAVLCKWCKKRDPACQCTHPTAESWMSLGETVDFLFDEIARLSADLGVTKQNYVHCCERVENKDRMVADRDAENKRLRSYVEQDARCPWCGGRLECLSACRRLGAVPWFDSARLSVSRALLRSLAAEGAKEEEQRNGT